jgi:GT2 family glycosyltransferase
MEAESPQPPKVTVLIVSFNCAGALRRCLAALEQSLGRETMEILVVDNGSRDECPRLDTEFPKITILRLPRNFGMTKAMNIGIRTATGDYVLLLRPGVEVMKETVSQLAARLDADESAVAVCPLLVNPQGETVSRTYPVPTRELLAEAAEEGRLPDGAEAPLDADAVAVGYAGNDAIMVRRQFLRGMNYFDERYGQYWADAELAWQIRSASRTMLLLAGVKAVRHQEEPPPASARALLSADCTLGAAAFLEKHQGFMAGMTFRLSAVLRSIFRALLLKQAGFHLSRAGHLISGSKVDGSQQEI